MWTPYKVVTCIKKACNGIIRTPYGIQCEFAQACNAGFFFGGGGGNKFSKQRHLTR